MQQDSRPDLEPHHPALGVAPDGKHRPVVVIDDEFSHRRVMSQILLSLGFHLSAEGVNGEDAVALTLQHRPFLTVLDFHMPRMDGLTAVQKIRERIPDQLIVMCTTETDRKKVIELLQLGVAEYIVKPISRRTVIEKIGKLIPPIPPSPKN